MQMGATLKYKKCERNDERRQHSNVDDIQWNNGNRRRKKRLFVERKVIDLQSLMSNYIYINTLYFFPLFSIW